MVNRKLIVVNKCPPSLGGQQTHESVCYVIAISVSISNVVLETKLAASFTSSLLGLIAGLSAGSLIAMVVVVSFVIYCVIKWKRRSVSSSASNKCRGNSNVMEELDNITHNSAYGQVKDFELAQDGGVVYETIKDNCIYESRPMRRMVLSNTRHHAMRILTKSSHGIELLQRNMFKKIFFINRTIVF